MNKILLSPPIAFLLVLGLMMVFSKLLSALSLKRSGDRGDICKGYACGEDVQTHLMQPDYSQFFPFAFFFMTLHVVALMIATAPINTLQSMAMPVIYILGAIVGLLILFRR